MSAVLVPFGPQHGVRSGITKTRANAASSVWWPGISQDITKVVQNCAMCEKYRRERIEPVKGTEFPDRPWSRVGVDFFQHKDKTLPPGCRLLFKRCRDMPSVQECELHCIMVTLQHH